MIKSVYLNSAGVIAWAGAGFKIVVTPWSFACRKRPSVTACGVSNWATRKSACSNKSVTWPTAVMVNAWLAPPYTKMSFWPLSSTVTRALPVACCWSVRTWAVSMWFACNCLIITRPSLSSPIAPIKAVWAPERAAATAWLAPLPPGATCLSIALIVSPGCGKCSTRYVVSMLMLPSTITRLAIASSPNLTLLSGYWRLLFRAAWLIFTEK